MATTDAIAHALSQKLADRAILSRERSAVRIRHESEGLTARFHVAHHEHRGQAVVRVAMDEYLVGRATLDSVAEALMDGVVSLVGRAVASN